jgi:hypothetical protein
MKNKKSRWEREKIAGLESIVQLAFLTAIATAISLILFRPFRDRIGAVYGFSCFPIL